MHVKVSILDGIQNSWRREMRVPRSENTLSLCDGTDDGGEEKTKQNTVKLFVINFKIKQNVQTVKWWLDVTSIGNMVTACCPWSRLQSTTAQEATGAIYSTYSTQSQVTLSLKVKFGKNFPKMALSFYTSQCMAACYLSSKFPQGRVLQQNGKKKHSWTTYEAVGNIWNS